MKLNLNLFKSTINIFLLKTKGQKRSFLTAGFVNVLITNLSLQVFLTIEIFSISFSTFLSQMVNMIIGYILYSKAIFKIKRIIVPHFLFKFTALMISLWFFNTIGIIYLTSLSISKNIAALLLVPLLASFSFLVQRFWVFKNSSQIFR